VGKLLTTQYMHQIQSPSSSSEQFAGWSWVPPQLHGPDEIHKLGSTITTSNPVAPSFSPGIGFGILKSGMAEPLDSRRIQM